ncbi:MAG: hypothetical protein RMK31_06965 [Candidatus Caldarchaeum sp.]|nr:hypothetical protein [Candidatus Caldarchaeum sp.]MDW8360304.1 hypothetical protein [Candidatus Caldarchaeum sp.]
MARKVLVALVAAVAVAVAAGLLLSNTRDSEELTADVIIKIPKGAAVPPKAWSSGLVFDKAYFDPPNVKVVINVNNTVRWINYDEVAHTATSLETPKGSAGFDSGLIAPSSGFTTKLNVAGRYLYYCSVHPWAGGIITVEEK